jgi:delta(3,5)-delta(2,4)-dienoyl-CoA isomerase
MWKEIGDAFSQLGARGDGCRAIILVGSGKAFCGGIDIFDSAFQMSPHDDVARRGLAFLPKIQQMQNCLTAVETCPFPVICAMHGSCIGAGIDLACCADVRLCSSDTTFSVREVRLGLAADVGTLQRFPKLCGHSSRVRELCLTGDDFNAAEALRIGFVSRNSPDIFQDAIRVACTIAANSPVAVAGTKLSLNYSRDHSVQEGLEHIARHNALALMSNDLSFVASGEVTFQELAPHARL